MIRMNSAEKNPNKDKNETSARQSREELCQSKGSIYVSNLWNSQGFNSTWSTRLESQNRKKQFNIKMGRKKYYFPMSWLSQYVGTRGNRTYEYGYKQNIRRGDGTIVREYGETIPYFKRDLPRFGGVSDEVGRLLQKEKKISIRTRLYAIKMYFKYFYRLWFKNKRGYRMKRIGVYTLLIIWSLVAWSFTILGSIELYGYYIR
jgi:hypothetical protein